MMHEISLTGYTASCNAADNMLCLGTAGSYGLEKLHVTADAAWNGLTITATFTNSGSTTVPVTDGAVDVPPEATRLPTRDRMRYGMLAFKGVDAQGKLRIISTPICYKVQASAATDGSNTIDPTPDQYAQFVAEVMAEADRAEAAANRAEAAGGNVTPEQIAEAVNNYLTENPVQATPIDATLTQSGQAADAAAVGNRLSALSEEIAAIPSGKDGSDGKSAYQYAVDGGYTGTETEFATKLAEEIPTALPNPNALTFTGAVTGSYDGSAPLEVEIPSGGGSGGSGKTLTLIAELTLEDAAHFSITKDSDGNNISESEIIITAYIAPYSANRDIGIIIVNEQGTETILDNYGLKTGTSGVYHEHRIWATDEYLIDYHSQHTSLSSTENRSFSVRMVNFSGKICGIKSQYLASPAGSVIKLCAWR